MVFRRKIPKRVNSTSAKWVFAFKKEIATEIKSNIKEELLPEVSIKIKVLTGTWHIDQHLVLIA